MIPAARIPNHPFYVTRNVVAEVVGDGLYRFTGKKKDGPVVSAVVNFTIGRAYVEAVEKTAQGRTWIQPYIVPLKDIEGSSEPEKFAYCKEILAEGDALLRENNQVPGEDLFMKRKLLSLYENLKGRPGVDPNTVRRGETAAILFDREPYSGFVAFEFAGNQEDHLLDTAFEQRHQVQAIFYPDGGRDLTYTRSQPWIFDTRDRWVRITWEEHAWLKALARFLEGDADPQEGKKLFELVSRNYENAKRFSNLMSQGLKGPMPSRLLPADDLGGTFL